MFRSCFLRLLLIWNVCFSTCAAYEIGKSYVYTYKGQVSTGVVDSTTEITQASGFIIEANLRIQKTKDEELFFQLSNVTLAPFNEKVEEFFEFFNLSYEREHDDKNAQAFFQEMELPFWVEFHQGVVSQTEFPLGSWKTTVNIKNALASLFQIKLSSNLSTYYTNLEDSIIGRCPVTYHIPDNKTLNFKDGVSMTKTLNYDLCKSTAKIFSSSIDGRPCSSDQQTEALKTVGNINYNLKGSQQRIVIDAVESNSVVTFIPFTTNGQTVLSTTDQKLHLVRIEGDKSVKKPSRTNILTSLHFQFYGQDQQHFLPIDLSHSHYYDRVHWMPQISRTQQIEDTISKIVADFKTDGLDADSVIKMIEELTFFEYDDFVEVFDKKYKIFEDTASSAKKEMRYILLEILPFVGTNPAVVYILNIINRNAESDLNLVHLLMQMPFHVKEPSDSLIDHFLEFAQFSIDGRSELLCSTAWYTFGSLLYRGCERGQFNPHPKFLPTYLHPEKCSFHLENLIESFADSSHDHLQQNTYLRSVCNTRMSDSFQFLKNVAKGKYSEEARRIAIKCLVNVNYDITEKDSEIISTVLPILLNKDETDFVRMSAFDVVITVQPETLPEIVHQLLRETNVRVWKYIYSTLDSYADSSDPCHRKIAVEAKRSLKLVASMNHAIGQSTNKIFSYFNEKYNFGHSTRLSVIRSNKTFLPSEIIFSQSINVLGYNFDLWEWTLQHDNCEEFDVILVTLLEKNGILDLYSQNNVTKTPNEMFKLLKSLKTKSENVLEKLKVTKKFLNQNVYSGFLFDFNPLRHVTAGETNKHNAFTLRYNKITYLNVEYVVANDMGFPLTLQLNVPLIVKSRGTFTLKSEKLQLGIPFAGIIDLDLAVGLDLAINSRMFVASSFENRHGYQVISRSGITIPVQTSGQFDLKSKHFDLRHIPPFKHNLILFENIPSTFGDDGVLPITMGNKSEETMDIGHSYLGFGFTYNLIHYNYWTDYTSFSNLFNSFVGKFVGGKSYSHLADIWYVFASEFLGYIVVNPEAKNFALKLDYQRSKVNPTIELTASLRKSAYKYYDDERARKDRWSFSKYDLEVVANGPIERKWLLEVHASAQSPPEQWKRLRVHFQRTSLPGYDEKPRAFCVMFNHQTVYSQLFTNPLDVKQEDPNMSFQLSLTFGNNCARYRNSIQISIKGKMIKSVEQLYEDRKLLSFYKKCQLDYNDGFKLSPECWRVKKHLGRLNRIELNVQYNGISDEYKTGISDVYLWFKHNFHDNLHIEEPKQIAGSGHNLLKIAINISSRQQNVDISIISPHKTTRYKNISLPKFLPGVEFPTVAEPFTQILARNLFNYQKPMCFISGDYVRTANQLIYHYELNSCFHLALANCHSERMLLFFRSIQHDSFTKSLRMFLDEDTIDIGVGIGGNKLVVNVNQVKIIVAEYVKFIQDDDGEKIEAYVIYPYWDGIVIESNYYDVVVFFNGNDVRIVVSGFLRGKLCGLCGHADEIGMHEMYDDVDYIRSVNATHLTNIYAYRDNAC